jgi:hypothetical protein
MSPLLSNSPRVRLRPKRIGQRTQGNGNTWQVGSVRVGSPKRRAPKGSDGITAPQPRSPLVILLQSSRLRFLGLANVFYSYSPRES